MIDSKLISLVLEAAVRAGDTILEVYQTPFTVERKADHSPITLADKNANEVIQRMLTETGIPVLSEEGREISYAERSTWSELWVVDPLDGTKEFIKQNGEFTVNIALVRNGFAEFGVIYQPVTDILYYGDSSAGAFKIQEASKKDLKELRKYSVAIGNDVLPKTFTIVASRSHLSPETAEYIDAAKHEHGTLDFISSGSSLKLCMIADCKAHVYPRFAPTMEWDTAAGHAIMKAAGKNIFAYSTGLELRYNKPDLLNDWFIAK